MPHATTPWKKLREFWPKSKRTLLSVFEANRFVRAINCFLGMRAGKGIVIHRAESGFVISWDANSPGEAGPPLDMPGAGGGGGGDMNFVGEWREDVQYYDGDIVWVGQIADLQAGLGGTFIANVDNINVQPPTAGLGNYDNGTWEVVAITQPYHNWWIDPDEDQGYTEIKGGYVNIQVDNAESPTYVVIDKNDIPPGTPALTIKLREITVCVGGADVKMLVLASESYT